MAQFNITLNQDEILQLLSSNREDAFKTLLTEFLNGVLQAESTAQLGAEPYERSKTRSDSRNGTRERPLNTRIGTITLSVPRHREKPFHTLVFENYSRSESALVTTMAEMVVNGVSTRKVATVMETLCGTSFSKSTVSEACKSLDKAVKDFKYRPLEGRYDFMYVDATYFKVRGARRIGSKAMMVALAITDDGKREFPNTPWQRCQTHFSRNILSHAPSKYQKAIHAELTEMYNCTTIEEARKKRDSIIGEYSDIAAKAMECLDNGFEDAMTIMAIPECFRKYMRTSNHLERLNKELKRRSKVIGVFPNEGSLNRIIGSVLVELNDVYSLEKSLPITKKGKIHLEDCTQTLILIAKEQQRLLAA